MKKKHNSVQPHDSVETTQTFLNAGIKATTSGIDPRQATVHAALMHASDPGVAGKWRTEQAVSRAASVEQQHCAIYSSEMTRFGQRPLDAGCIADRLTRGFGYSHRAAGCNAGDSAGHIYRAAEPVPCTADCTAEGKSHP